jgi:acyl-ACP thioesterase
MPISSVYSKTFIIPKSAIDENGHVNNVAYVQWMHAESALPWNIILPLGA